MKSQTSLVAKQFRLQTWAAQIQDCQNRPEGMSVDDWCLQNNITKANYYYRLKCVRQACLDSIQPAEPAFVELRPAETPLLETTEPKVSAEAVSAVLHTSQGITIDLYDSASSDFLRKILGALTYAE